MKKGIAALAISLGLVASSCLGVNSADETKSFPTWHAVKEWNNNVTDNKWLNEGVFIVCNIIPVYGVASIIDVLVMNSIEFWTAE